MTAELDTLLETLKVQRGFDFTGYKRSSLERRIAKRMESLEIADHVAYSDHLEMHPEEYERLFDTIFINVTAFFRDPDAWAFLAEQVIPRMLELTDGGPIRLWSAGCASGEEIYSVATLLVDALGEDAYLERVKLYATDVDDDALEAARAARYTEEQVQAIPEHLRRRCFERDGDDWCFRKDLRRTVIFGRNDLVQDAPISRIDLLLCRNTLMYFNVETQGRILSRFHFALNPSGFLFMGKAEMLITHGDLFRPVEANRRVFTKVPRGRGARVAADVWAPDRADGVEVALPPTLRDVVLETAPVAQVVVDADGRVQIANAAARALLPIAADGVGQLIKDLELSYRPLELRSHLDRAMVERLPIALDAVDVPDAAGNRRTILTRVTPLVDGQELLGVHLSFSDVTATQRLKEELETSKRELERSYDELQSTVEELETTNEELQSTNEELETTNEELQSTNEELETMNEELHSTNEELESINDELRQRTVEVDEVNAFMETVLQSLGLSVIVLDAGLRVQVWNEGSVELWGLREHETVGHELLELDFGMPVEPLRAALEATAGDRSAREELTLDAVNRRGRPVTARVVVLRLRGERLKGPGVIVLVEARDRTG